MLKIMCGECGRRHDLEPEALGKAKCVCGGLLTESDVEAPTSLPENADDLEAVKHLKAAYDAIRDSLSQVIIGQDQVIEEMLVAIFARGHCLLEGVTGLAKTLMISTLAKAMDLSFKRIQFTPDLMPSDITGTEVIQEDRDTGKREFRFIRGPIFANIILADEINRTPPKTQSALLEGMQERSVTVAGAMHQLDLPFFVLATQNPLEQEGTYPLPEAQLDRFLFKISVDYPTSEEELEIMQRVTSAPIPQIEPVLDGPSIVRLQDIVLRVPVAEHVFLYARNLVRATRPRSEEAPGYINNWIRWGAGPRASLNLILAGKARAILNGQLHATCDDIAAVAPPILRHRLACTFTAQAEGVTSDRVVERLLDDVPQTKQTRTSSRTSARKSARKSARRT